MNTLPTVLLFFLLFAFTVVCEGLVVLVLFRSWQTVYSSFLCNLLTNPAMNMLLLLGVSLFGLKIYPFLLAALEILVVAVEAFVYNKLEGWPRKRAVLFSLIINAVSFGAGLVLNSWIF